MTNLHTILDDAAAQAPEAAAIRDPAGRWTYAELAAASRRFAGWLAERGVSAGDRVLTQSPNCRELAAVLFGCARRGAVLVPLNPGMKPFHLRAVMADCEPSIALTGAGQADDLGHLGDPVGGIYELPSVWPEVAARTAEPVTGPDNGIAALLYTSGSTAAPKAVVCPHAQMVFAAKAIGSVLGLQGDDVILCQLPMSFDYGLYQLLLATLARAELVVSGDTPDITVLRQVRACGATVVPVVPSLASMLTRLAERDPGPTKVRLFTNTGAALPQATIDALRTGFPGARVSRMFGTTECKRITIMPPDQERERPSSVGMPLPGTEVIIADEHGGRQAPGVVGEIVVRGPHVMAGYWRLPEITARTFRRDAVTGEVWLHTGDYGYLDEDGYLYFEGRRDDMFKHRGTRMSTIEIEAAAMDIAGVRGCVALPPAEGGNLEICVETDLPPHTVLRELAARLEPAKVPGVCHVVDSLPLTLNGKNERRTLAESIRKKV